MRLWVDMDNAPHVLVLRPIIQELERRGHVVEITARDFGQTLPLLRLYGMRARRIGRHGGKNPVGKLVTLLWRSARLFFFGAGRHFDAVFCHGARGVFPAARLLRLPLITMGDYEHAARPAFFFRWPVLHLVPEVMQEDIAACRGILASRIVGYSGLKEDLYVHDFQPDPAFLTALGIDPSKVLVILRPPATMAHYAVRESGSFFLKVLDWLGRRTDLEALLLPRTQRQGKDLDGLIEKAGSANIRIPSRVYHGPSLIWYADVVISGGGTMNREAATLGVPVVSIYQGPMGAVDRYLIRIGKLRHVSSLAQLEELRLVKRVRPEAVPAGGGGSQLKRDIADRIIEAAHAGPRRVTRRSR